MANTKKSFMEMVQPKTFLKTLALIHLVLVMGLVLFGLFTFFQSEGFVFSTEGDNDILLYLIPIAAIAGYFGSQIIFKQLLSKIQPRDDTAIKLAKYQMATLIKFAVIEVPTLLALVAFYLTFNALYFVIAICMTAYLFIQRPNKNRLFTDVQLNFEEQELFNTLIN